MTGDLALEEDPHPEAPRISLLVKESQVEELREWASAYGAHVHLIEPDSAPVKAGPGEVWASVCRGEAGIQGDRPSV